MKLNLSLLDVIQHVAPDEIKEANFNPHSRTVRRALGDLYRLIEKAGRVKQALVVASVDGVLADGHRRLACAKLLKLPTIPVVVQEGTSAELFQELNSATRKTDSAMWHEGVALGLPTVNVPDKERVIIDRMIHILGWEDYQVIALEGITSHIFRVAESVGRYVGDTSDATMKEVLHWLYNLNMQRPSVDAMRHGTPPEVLKRAIAENKKLNSQIVWVAE